MAYSIFIIDDNDSTRQEVSLLTKMSTEYIFAGGAGNGEDAIQILIKNIPDIVLLDWSMPGMNGLEVLQKIVRDFPHIKVIMLSMHTEEVYSQVALNSGAAGYLAKQDLALFFEQALNKVILNEIYISPSVNDFIVTHQKDYKN